MSINSKIMKLIEEANQQTADAVSKWRGGDIVGALGIPGGLNYAGYKAGEELGHPVAGAMVGQDAAAGARSNYDPSTTIGDVYTGKNMLKKAVQGGIPMAAFGAAVGGPAGALAGGLGGAVSGAATTPGISYGIGKLFGGQPTELTKKSPAIK